MRLQHENQVPGNKPSFDDLAQKQRRHMLIALTMLVVALIVVLTKDYEFWFPSAPALQSESEPIAETLSEPKAQSAAANNAVVSAPAWPNSKIHTPNPAAPGGSKPGTESAPVLTHRAVLPSLGVEVVTGDQHSTVQAGSNSVQVDLGPKTPSGPLQASSNPAMPESADAANTSAQSHLSRGATQLLSRPVQPVYPLLAKEMKIQGAVVMEALIGRDGTIQHLDLLSGPAILSVAAREAVKQWRFKPYVQSGEAVETEARITVNFTIWTQ